MLVARLIVACPAGPQRHHRSLGAASGKEHIKRAARFPRLDVFHGELESDAARLGNLVATFGSNVERLLRTEREAIIDQQYQQGRIADAAIELYVSACVVRRLDAIFGNSREFPNRHDTQRDLVAGRYYLHSANRRIRRALADLWDNDDGLTTETADSVLP